MLDWIYHVWPTYSMILPLCSKRNPKNTLFTMVLINTLVKGALVPLKSNVVAHFSRPAWQQGMPPPRWNPWCKGKDRIPEYQRPNGGHVSHREKQECVSNPNALAFKDLWWWLTGHGTLRNEIDGQPSRVWLHLHDRKISKYMTWDAKVENHSFSLKFPE